MASDDGGETSTSAAGLKEIVKESLRELLREEPLLVARRSDGATDSVATGGKVTNNQD